MVIERLNDCEIKVRAGFGAVTKSERGQRGIANFPKAEGAEPALKVITFIKYKLPFFAPFFCFISYRVIRRDDRHL